MLEPSQGPNSFEGPPETKYGGADAVEKTSDVVGRGTDPNAMDPGHPLPAVRPARSIGWGVILILLLALAIALVYGAGLFG